MPLEPVTRIERRRSFGYLTLLLLLGGHACVPEPVQEQAPQRKSYENRVRFDDGTSADLRIDPDSEGHYRGSLDLGADFTIDFAGTVTEGVLVLESPRVDLGLSEDDSRLTLRLPDFPASLGGAVSFEDITETFTPIHGTGESLTAHLADGSWPFDFTYPASVSETVRFQVALPMRIRGRFLFTFFDGYNWTPHAISNKAVGIPEKPQFYIQCELRADRSFQFDDLLLRGRFNEAFTTATFEIAQAVTIVVEKGIIK